MKYVLLLLLTGVAQAATPLTFDTPTYCSTYCTGYTTYSSEHTVGFVIDSAYQPGTVKLTLQFDGITYSGIGAEVPITTGIPYYATLSAVPLANSAGQVVTASVVVFVKRVAVSSGRAHYYVWRHWVQSGEVTLP